MPATECNFYFKALKGSGLAERYGKPPQNSNLKVTLVFEEGTPHPDDDQQKILRESLMERLVEKKSLDNNFFFPITEQEYLDERKNDQQTGGYSAE